MLQRPHQTCPPCLGSNLFISTLTGHLKAQVKGQFSEDFSGIHGFKAESVLGNLWPWSAGLDRQFSESYSEGSTSNPSLQGIPKGQGLFQAIGMRSKPNTPSPAEAATLRENTAPVLSTTADKGDRKN